MPAASVRVDVGGAVLVSFRPADSTLLLGFTDGPAGATVSDAALFGIDDVEELEQGLEFLVARFCIYELIRHLRRSSGVASGDEWMEASIANAVAASGSLPFVEPRRPFLLSFLQRAVVHLERFRRTATGDDAARADFYLFFLRWFPQDVARTDLPPFDDVLAGVVNAPDALERRRAESELVLLQTLGEGPPSLRRAAAELFAQEASTERISRVLETSPQLPHDVRLLLASRLALREGGGPALELIATLATGAAGVSPPVLTAAALLVDDPERRGVDPAALLALLENDALVEALELVAALPTQAAVAAVWPLLQHAHPPVRREANRLLAAVIPGAALTSARDPEPDVRSVTAVEKALVLRTVPLFRSVPTQNLLALAGGMHSGEHAAGEAIVRQGDVGGKLFVLAEGQARALKELPDGSREQLAELPAGSVFGEMSLFDDERRSATILAVEPCRTLTLDGRTFHRVALQYPEILWEIARVLSQRVRSAPSSSAP